MSEAQQLSRTLRKGGTSRACTADSVTEEEIMPRCLERLLKEAHHLSKKADDLPDRLPPLMQLAKSVAKQMTEQYSTPTSTYYRAFYLACIDLNSA